MILEDPTPAPPAPPRIDHLRVIEAVLIAALSAVATKAVEWAYEGLKERRKKKE